MHTGKTNKNQNKSSIFKSLISFLYPPKCALCGIIGEENLCPDCQNTLNTLYEPKKFLAPGGNGFADGMITLFPYKEKPVQKLLFDWKHTDYTDLHEIFRPYMEKAVKKGFFPSTIHRISYLPRTTGAKRNAGFDQAEKIAQELGKILNLPVEPLLKRQGHSKPQHKTNPKKREENVRGHLLATTDFQGDTILLVDDIITTGETAKEGARVLKKNGAMKVYIFSLAH